MTEVILYIQIVLSILVTILILIQSRGGGLGRSFGNSVGNSFTRRGVEKWLFKVTFVAVAFFIVVSIIQLFF